jgi:hypothetical protein
LETQQKKMSAPKDWQEIQGRIDTLVHELRQEPECVVLFRERQQEIVVERGSSLGSVLSSKNERSMERSKKHEFGDDFSL